MRILHVVPSYLPAVRYGGPIYAVHALCRALAARGHAVEVFTTNVDGTGVSPVPLDKPVTLDGVQVRYFPSPLLRRLYWSPAMGRALKRHVRTVDVVHTHSVFLWPTWAAARAARRPHVPHVVSPRGMLVKELIMRRSRLAKTLWIELIDRRNIESAAAVHVTSQNEARELARFGWRLPPVTTIGNGADDVDAVGSATVVSPDIREAVAQQPLVLYLGRLSWVKGLDRLLQAFALTDSGTLAIVGTDDEHLAPALSSLADKLGIAARVRIVPRLTVGADKERLLASANVFVLASHSESFGNAVLEAMRRSVPVVVTRGVGAADAVRESGGGLVAGDDPRQIADAIARLLHDPALAKSMGAAGQAYAQRHYAWSGIAERMENVYASLRAGAPQVPV